MTPSYLANRDLMATGDLLLWSSNSLIGAAIRLFTRSNVNHASLIIRLKEYEGEDRRRYHGEAVGRGVLPVPLSTDLEQHDGSCWWYPLRQEWDHKRGEIGRRMIEMFGKRYDYRSLLRNALGHVSADSRRLFCSEYCYLSLGLQGMAPRPNELLRLGAWEMPGVQIK